MSKQTAQTPRTQSISLLWQQQKLEEMGELAPRINEDCIRDLELIDVIRELIPVNDFRFKGIKAIFANLCTDAEVLNYRQEVLKDLLNNPRFVEGLQDVAPHISSLNYRPHGSEKDDSGLFEVAWRLGQIDLFATAIQKLGVLFDEIEQPLQSEALMHLEAAVREVAADPVFNNLLEELPELRQEIHAIASITIGVNLDTQMRPVEATLVSVNKERFKESGFLKRILGKSEFEAVSKIHSVPRAQPFTNSPGGMRIYTDQTDYSPSSFATEPYMVPLFKDLLTATKEISKPIAKAMERYLFLNVDLFSHLQEELPFYLGAVALVQNLEAAGMPMCCPKILPMDDRTCDLQDAYNINLALNIKRNAPEKDLTEHVVPNDIRMGVDGRIFIVTGPNQGGKTTYLQSIGLIQVLAQAGIFVPASRARISPVDGIFSHFPIEEKLARATGRFGDEAKRLNEIFEQATKHSFVLLNETFSSTNAGESRFLAEGILRILRMMGARVVFTTHMHELAEQVEILNEFPGDSDLVSMVATVANKEAVDDLTKRTYKIIPSPPMGHSYAHEIAERYGISFEQLSSLLAKREVLKV